VNLNEDTEFRNVINILKQLQQVKAPVNFEADLMRRINSAKYPVEKSFWRNIFIPSRLVPAASLVVIAVVLVFILNNPGVTQENPFSTVPRERQELASNLKTKNIAAPKKNIMSDKVTSSKGAGGIRQEGITRSEPAEKSMDKENQAAVSARQKMTEQKSINDKYINVRFASGRITDYPVNKAGLNFRQVNLSHSQKIELNQLKQQMETMFRKRLR
jgi:hypothetical protein